MWASAGGGLPILLMPGEIIYRGAQHAVRSDGCLTQEESCLALQEAHDKDVKEVAANFLFHCVVDVQPPRKT